MNYIFKLTFATNMSEKIYHIEVFDIYLQLLITINKILGGNDRSIKNYS